MLKGCPDGCMVQIHKAMSRAVGSQRPLKAEKWKAELYWNGRTYEVHLFHYHHLILRYDLWERKVLYQWYERRADKRGLESALIWLEAYNKGKEASQ